MRARRELERATNSLTGGLGATFLDVANEILVHEVDLFLEGTSHGDGEGVESIRRRAPRGQGRGERWGAWQGSAVVCHRG